MPRTRNKENVTENKDSAIEKINSLLIELINSNDEKLLKRADLISFWIKSFSSLVKGEDTFNPKYLLKYKRGDVIKVDFGYRCKNELGGLHYAIVLDVENSKSSGLITVVPLTSKKPDKKLHHSEVELGNEIFTALISTHDKLLNKLNNRLESESISQGEAKSIQMDLKALSQKRDEILKMKEGSIAMVGHISTISKARIKDPINKYNGILCDVKVSTTTLSAIDHKIAKMFTGAKLD